MSNKVFQNKSLFSFPLFLISFHIFPSEKSTSIVKFNSFEYSFKVIAIEIYGAYSFAYKFFDDLEAIGII